MMGKVVRLVRTHCRRCERKMLAPMRGAICGACFIKVPNNQRKAG